MSRGRIELPRLDDRSWREIVDQTLALVPRYAGEKWTDLSPSDPGVILVELFAFLVESLAFRLDQVPDRTYVEFLNLLGTTRLPPTPASTMLTYTALGGEPVEVQAGHQVATPQTESQVAVVFETEALLRVVPANLKVAYVLEPGAATVRDVSVSLVASPLNGLELEVAPTQRAEIYLGLDAAIAEAFDLAAHGVRLAETSESHTSWSYSRGGDWSDDDDDPLEVVDGTADLRRPARIQFSRLEGWSEHPLKDLVAEAEGLEEPKFWLRLTIEAGSDVVGDPDALRVKIGHILLNSVSAVAALSVPELDKELLGTSDGSPFQSFELANHPLYKISDSSTPYSHLHVEIDPPLPDSDNKWDLVEDFPPGPSQAFRVDPVTATIRFGDYDPQSRPRGAGLIPPSGRVIRAWYRFVGSGSGGNVPPGTITVQRRPQIARVGVTNLAPAVGGSDEESLEDAKARPESLRNRDRAVTVEDVQILAANATTDVRKVRCLPPKLDVDGNPESFGNLPRTPGTILVLIVPDEPNDQAPRPSLALVREVRRSLNDRRVLGTGIDVSGPLYLPVKAGVSVFLWPSEVGAGRPGTDRAELERVLQRRISQFLHPLTGGTDGRGWEFGQMLFAADLYAELRSLIPPEVGFIKDLTVEADENDPEFHRGPRPGADQLPRMDPATGVSIAEFELICAARQQPPVIFEPVAPIAEPQT